MSRSSSIQDTEWAHSPFDRETIDDRAGFNRVREPGLAHHLGWRFDPPSGGDTNERDRAREAGIEPFVGSHGEAYDNALVETMIGLYKTDAAHVFPPVARNPLGWYACAHGQSPITHAEVSCVSLRCC